MIDAPVSIAKASDPAHAVRSTPDASIVRAAKAVAKGEAQALVSGGSTGSALAAGLFNIRRDRGIYRPALALPLPMLDGPPVLLLDVGANVSCRPEHLVQFAHMGSAFSHAVLGCERPRVALLSNGEEPNKGTPDLVYVHEQLAGSVGTGLNFIGNIEGTHITDGVADVVVMDGFIGNITLKLIEGVSDRTLRGVRDAELQLPARQARRPAADARDATAARRHRPRTAGRRVPARPAPARRGRARALYAPWLSARDRGRRARGGGGCDQRRAVRPGRRRRAAESGGRGRGGRRCCVRTRPLRWLRWSGYES